MLESELDPEPESEMTSDSTTLDSTRWTPHNFDHISFRSSNHVKKVKELCSEKNEKHDMEQGSPNFFVRGPHTLLHTC